MTRLVCAVMLIGLSLGSSADAAAQPAAPTLDKLLQQLQQNDPRMQLLAADALGRMGTKAEKAIPALLTTLKNTDLELEDGYRLGAAVVQALVAIGPKSAPGLALALKEKQAGLRVLAADGLGQLGPKAASAVPALTAALQDGDFDVRVTAAEALGTIGPKAGAAIPGLLELLKDKHNIGKGTSRKKGADSSREAAVAALLKIDPQTERRLLRDGVPILLEGLKSADPTEREHTARALAPLGAKARKTIPALLEMMSDESGNCRHAAGEALQHLGPEGYAALASLLKDPNVTVRRAAVSALGFSWRRGRDKAVPALIDALQDDDIRVRAGAVEALGELGRLARPAIPALIRNLADSDLFKRQPERIGNDFLVAAALRRIGPSAVPALMDALNGDKVIARIQAARALGEMGTAAAEALPALEQAMRDKYIYVSLESARAAVSVGGDARYPVKLLVALAKEGDSPTVRDAALRALAALGVKAKAAIPALIDVLKDDDVGLRRLAVRALAAMGAEARDAAGPLAKLLDAEEDVFFRLDIIDTLARIGPAAKTAVSALAKTLTDKDVNVRDRAAGALGHIGAEAKSAVPALVLLLQKDAESFVRNSAFEALGKIGAGAKAAVPQLIKMIATVADFERARVARTLAEIGPAARDAVPALKDALRSTNGDLRVQAAHALIAIVGPNPAWLEVIRSGLQKESRPWSIGPVHTYGAAQALAHLGPVAKEAVPDLVAVLSEASPGTQARVIEALGSMGEAAAPAVPALLALVQGYSNRLEAVKALGQIGPKAKPALTALKRLIYDENPEIAAAAATALKAIDAKAALPQAGTAVSYSKGNFRLVMPSGWSRSQQALDEYQVVLSRFGNFIMVSAVERSITAEELLADFEEGAKLQSTEWKVVTKEEADVGGARAIKFVAEAKVDNAKRIFRAYFFSHQGVGYRVVSAPGLFSTDVGAPFEAVADSFSFLESRTEWVEKAIGQATPVVFLGGLCRFEINMPRWAETNLNPNDYPFLERIDLGYFDGGGWLTVRGRTGHGSPEAERDTLKSEVLSPQSTMRETRLKTWKSAHGDLAGFEMHFDFNGPRFMRGAVAVRDGLVVQIYMECLEAHRAATLHDWHQLLDTFHLDERSKPAQPLLYALSTGGGNSHVKDPVLETVVSAAQTLVPEPRQNTVVGISPDGTQMLVRDGRQTVLENLATRKRTILPLNPQPSGFELAWDRSGKRIAYTTYNNTVHVVTLEPFHMKTLKISASHVSFGPHENDLLVCVRAPLPPGRFAMFSTSKLEKVRISDGSSDVLVEFPLSRVSHAALSPDGKHIALVCNRDYPRTAATGGHLYVCDADGSKLRQLTKDPEEIIHLAWSRKGQDLYVVRRLALGTDGAVGVGGAFDLFRVAVATGKAVNLTRSGRIGRIWARDVDVAIEVLAWDAAPSQRGIFRVAPDKLEQATSKLPVPPVVDTRRQVKAVSDAVIAELGKVPVNDVVPTPELLDRLAKAFATSAGKAYEVKLDFSATSLDVLSRQARNMDITSGDRALVLGFGAYYGETLRRVAGAEWKLQAVRFGDWLPASRFTQNALARVVFPFSEPYRFSLGGEGDRVLDTLDLRQREPGQKLLLVYPPAFAEQALREASGLDYAKARKLLDAGDVEPALDILVQLAGQRPRSRMLAEEVLSLGEAVGAREQVDKLVVQMVEAGNESPDVLLRYGDMLVVKKQMDRALEAYRKAAQGTWPYPEALFKLGQALADEGDLGGAAACWRRLYPQATPAQRNYIRSKLDMPPEFSQPFSDQ